MPYKKKFRKRRRKRFRRRRKNKFNSISSMKVRGVSIIPDRVFVKLKYATTFAMTSTGINTYIFRGNSLFDPDFTGIGHQPKGFDEWSALYSRYKVHASSIRIMASSADVGNSLLSVVPLIESTPQFTLNDDIRETPYVKNRYLQGGTPTSYPNNRIFLKSFMKTKSIRGERILDDDYSALTSANPSKLWHWHVIGSSVEETEAPVLRVMITLIYSCEFFRRKALQQS